jgi:hypothetical protein
MSNGDPWCKESLTFGVCCQAQDILHTWKQMSPDIQGR